MGHLVFPSLCLRGPDGMAALFRVCSDFRLFLVRPRQVCPDGPASAKLVMLPRTLAAPLWAPYPEGTYRCKATV